MNKTAKGNNIERGVEDFMQAHGYESERARLSKGVFDRIFTRGEETRYVQIKGMNKPRGWGVTKSDKARMLKARLPQGATREVIRHIGHPGVICTPAIHMAARRLAQDGRWEHIPLLPEWEGKESGPGLPGPLYDDA